MCEIKILFVGVFPASNRIETGYKGVIISNLYIKGLKGWFLI